MNMVIYILARMGQGGMGFHHVIQNDKEFKNYEL